MALILVVCLFFMGCLQSESVAAELSKTPMLRLETGMHTATIRRIAVDADNRYLVTSSDDKTVRVWELPTGRPMRILRPPIGDANEGMLFAVALSPDGRTIAAGGWTGSQWDRSLSIYLFDRISGAITKRLTGLRGVANHLIYSRDGRFLVACLGGESGIRLYRTSDYRQIAEDRNYGFNSYYADFDYQGRLVVTSTDGFIRLYEINPDGGAPLKRMARVRATRGSDPFQVSFSPDGTKIAVGFNDSPQIEVLSGSDLSFLYSPDTTGVIGSLNSVAWSSDGRSLFAGGKFGEKGGLLRKWSDGGRGGYKDIKAADNTIMQLLPLKGGGIAFGAAGPAFGIINAEDERVLFQDPPVADYRNHPEGFLLSPDGKTVRFGYEAFQESPAEFSLADRLLQVSAESGSGALFPPITDAEGINVTDWASTEFPKLNRSPLKLEPSEISKCLAIAPDRESFLLGTEWRLILFDRKGEQKWSVLAPGVVVGVNISRNGKVAAAALGDGTVRWYGMKDGKELLAFFPHKDRKKWVLWTPSGYYDCHPGAEEMIGWHINTGTDSAADFFPLSRFRGTYYRPELIALVLETVDEKEALRRADEAETDGTGADRKTAKPAKPVIDMLPPVVSILSPEDNAEVFSTEIAVKYSIRAPSGEPVSGVKALVNGRPVLSVSGPWEVKEGKEIKEVRVAVPKENSEISIIAANKHSFSAPASVRIRWKEQFIIKPKLYLLAVGVSRYENKELALGLSAKDARDFAEAMLKQQGGLYQDVVIKVLTDEQATKDEVVGGFDWIEKETTSKDVAMIYLSGHGVNDPNGIYYYLPVNANLERLKWTGIPFTDVKNTLSSLAGKTLIFIDTCHSGNILGGRRGLFDLTRLINELTSAENGSVVFASSTGFQTSLESDKWGNGAFTKALVEGINGKADYTGNGKITINMLDLYLSERVKELTGGKQTPTTSKPETIPDFPVALRREALEK